MFFMFTPERLSVAQQRATYAMLRLFGDVPPDKRNRDPGAGSPLVCGNPTRVPAAPFLAGVKGIKAHQLKNGFRISKELAGQESSHPACIAKDTTPITGRR
jgi:hypothetical protein